VLNRISALFSIQKAEIVSKHGIIQSVTLTSPDMSGSLDLEAVANTLRGSRYGFASFTVKSSSSAERGDASNSSLASDDVTAVKEIRAWLVDEMAR
jgi:hypothetical protein